MSDERFLALEGLTLAYGPTVAVAALDLTMREGELLALLGPSGCGKTTTMRAIAGLLRPRAGHIFLAGRDITRLSPNRREVGLVFQSYALFPHLSVYDNVAFGLRLRRTPEGEQRGKVGEALESVGLAGLERRLPKALSGGQQQRVALARSLVVRPRLLLLDEPLSNLDARLRLEMRSELRRLQRELGTTMIYVTHDQAEALALADRVVVMRAGKIEQAGTPEEIYQRPRSVFVARFMGFENTFALNGSMLTGVGGSLPLGGAAPATARAFGWRPNAVVVGSGPHRAEVLGVSYLGDAVEYLLSTPAGPIKAAAPAAAPRFGAGMSIAFDLPLAAAAVMESAE